MTLLPFDSPVPSTFPDRSDRDQVIQVSWAEVFVYECLEAEKFNKLRSHC